MSDNNLAPSARVLAHAMREEIERAHASDEYLISAIRMIFSEIERNLALLNQSGPTTLQQARVRVSTAIVELISLQLSTGRFLQDDGTLSVLGLGLSRLQEISLAALKQETATPRAGSAPS